MDCRNGEDAALRMIRLDPRFIVTPEFAALHQVLAHRRTPQRVRGR